MAAPTYSHDLTDYELCEATTNFLQIGSGNIALGAGPDFAIQGTNAVDGKISSSIKGMGASNGVIPTTVGVHIFIWSICGTQGLLATQANGGKRIITGNGTSNYMQYYVEGSDTVPEGGMKNYAIRHTNVADGTTKVAVGTVPTQASFVGGLLNAQGQAKGSNFGLDAIRYGTGAFITNGDMITPATFAGFATLNDNNNNRWGLLSFSQGTYKLQGKFVVGQNSTGTPVAARFEDANRVVTITDTPFSETDFTQIIVDHASTIFNLTNITILALGTNNPGQLVFNNASTISLLKGCTFSSIGTTVLRAGVTVEETIWRQSKRVTVNGATISTCSFTASTDTTAMITSNLATITDCTFKSSGTGHAVELTSLGSGTMTWSNYFNGYAGTDGVSGNEVIFVNVASGNITINVADGYNVPTYRTAGAVVNIIAGLITTQVKVIDISTGAPIEGANVFVKADSGGAMGVGTQIIKGLTDASGEIQDQRVIAVNQPVVGWVRMSSGSPYYKQSNIVATINSSTGLQLIVQLISDE